jgi:NADH:ubiquinone oxidoreductase subunit E
VAIQLADRQEELAEFSQEQLAQVDEIVQKNRGKPGALIPVLEDVQSALGYLPVAIQVKVAQGLNIPIADVYGVVSFYSFFTMVPKGRHGIRVCVGTACYVKGAQRLFEKLSSTLNVEKGGCTEDRRFSLETVRCLGVCGIAPVIVIDEEAHGLLEAKTVEKILDPYE